MNNKLFDFDKIIIDNPALRISSNIQSILGDTQLSEALSLASKAAVAIDTPLLKMAQSMQMDYGLADVLKNTNRLTETVALIQPHIYKFGDFSANSFIGAISAGTTLANVLSNVDFTAITKVSESLSAMVNTGVFESSFPSYDIGQELEDEIFRKEVAEEIEEMVSNPQQELTLSKESSKAKKIAIQILIWLLLLTCSPLTDKASEVFLDITGIQDAWENSPVYEWLETLQEKHESLPKKEKITRQVKSKQRVADHGEVFTAEREVNAMLDLVKQETERIDSRFLEPACGDGNFLVEILRRKLAVVKANYKKSPADYEKYSVIAITSIYGVDIMQDNVLDCRERLFEIWNKEYTANCKKEATDECRDSVKYILERNILCGNALSLMQVDENGNDTDKPIIFSEWSLVMGSSIKRRDFRLDVLLREHEETSLQFSLFGDDATNPDYWETDPVTKETIPAPTKEYPLTDYRRLRQNG